MANQYLLELRGVTKLFPAVKALDQVELSVKSGSVHALLGENGAGKSTLMNIITGVYQPDEGEIEFEGRPVRFSGVDVSRKAGIGLVHQEGSLLPDMDVRSNLFLGRYPSRCGFVNHKRLSRLAREFLDSIGMEEIDECAVVETLSTAQRQLVEIAKALIDKPKLLLLDEPTASLTEREVELLFKIIRSLQQEGVGIIYISHRLDEIFQICDRITVFRDGKHIITDAAENFTFDSMITSMVGRSLNEQAGTLMKNREDVLRDERVLELDHLSRKGFFEDISISLRKGEVLGLAGLVGAGRSSLLESMFGFSGITSGSIRIKGKQININHPNTAIRHKVAFIPEDRKYKGLSMAADIRENINISTMRRMRGRLLLSESKQNKAAEKYCQKLRIKTDTVFKQVNQLSGGNQQKVIISRWLQTEPEIMLLDEPTHGIDVGAKQEIYKMIEDLTRQGISVVVASSEMTELMLLCDRIAVMCEGRITGCLSREEATEDKILTLASGEIQA